MYFLAQLCLYVTYLPLVIFKIWKPSDPIKKQHSEL